MKRTTEIKLRRRYDLDYQKGEQLGLCADFVDSLVKSKPSRILVQVHARRLTANQGGYKVARRVGWNSVVVGRGKTKHVYSLVGCILASIGVATGDKFWFRITAL